MKWQEFSVVSFKLSKRHFRCLKARTHLQENTVTATSSRNTDAMYGRYPVTSHRTFKRNINVRAMSYTASRRLSVLLRRIKRCYAAKTRVVWTSFKQMNITYSTCIGDLHHHCRQYIWVYTSVQHGMERRNHSSIRWHL